jgi:hypothetical protein
MKIVDLRAAVGVGTFQTDESYCKATVFGDEHNAVTGQESRHASRPECSTLCDHFNIEIVMRQLISISCCATENVDVRYP